MLTKHEFAALDAMRRGGVATQRDLAGKAGLSLGSANAACRALAGAGYCEGFRVTEEGMRALDPYKVDNAVIMAAGLSSRFAPLSYERPKGLLRVRGEVLIERQIRQLHEAGIDDITVVVGYKKEQFFYLEERFGVKIRVNESYLRRNNNSTLKLVEDILGNTYICSSDDYFVENPFEDYVYQAYYAAEYACGPTSEYCLEIGSGDAITGIRTEGAYAWFMIGHAYFDRSFSDAFVRILNAVYDDAATAGKLWEDIYADHVKDLRMVVRRYEPGTIFEFDSLDDVRAFDPDFIENIDSEILDNICATLHCARADISGIRPIKEGLTNLSFAFDCAGNRYVYRHPGAGTDAVINRKSEAASEAAAKRLGIDDTFIYQDPDKGWKISRYVEGCVPFDYHDEAHVAQGLALGRALHESGETSDFGFDVYAKACQIARILEEKGSLEFPGFSALADAIARVYARVSADGVAPCLCHNDFYAPNFLVFDGGMYLIDWEYSGMSDYASDLGTFICCSDYSYDEALDVLARYFGRKPTEAELRHCIGYVAISAYYWFVWAIYKDVSGEPVGEWMYLWYRFASEYGQRALELYEGKGE